MYLDFLHFPLKKINISRDSDEPVERIRESGYDINLRTVKKL